MIQVEYLRIVSADSSAAILNRKFEPQLIVAASATLVTPPYREPKKHLAKPIYVNVEKGHEVILIEAELCRELLKTEKADVVHLDMSLGAIPLERLSPIQLSNIRVTRKAKKHLIKVLPRLRRISSEVRQKCGVEFLAIGKESIPVRIAELTAGAHAILYACDRALEEKKMVLLGLPTRCQHRLFGKRIYLHSLIAGEHDIMAYAEDKKDHLKRVNIVEVLNPVARGFRTLRITPHVGK